MFIILLWYLIGVVLVVFWILVGIFFFFYLLKLVYKFFGVGVVVCGILFLEFKDGFGWGGYLYVCLYRMLLDFVMVGVVLKWCVMVVMYSISWLLEVLFLIKIVVLKRNWEKDVVKIRFLLWEGDFVICFEGIICWELYLLWFSVLFVELLN